ncbi:site-specific DNA-methyltransferase [Methylocystis rosea]|uniref:site-specific DNA-methyltransferase n=1 Tax=Methylocystis rosea TaxID=173366 RepID=UPI0003746F78|nr:DNA methyltransferase [Methylocystis rosea]
MSTIAAFDRQSANSGRGPSVAPATTPSNCNVSLRALDELKPNPRSARTHPKRKIKDLAKAIKAVGFIGVIVVDESGMILAGHARHAAAKLLGMKTVPTICVTGLRDELIRAFVLADNKFSERAGWNREILAAELEELSILLPSLDLDISLAGFELGEIDVLLADIGAEKPEPEDRLPPTAGPPVSGRGDLWILGKHRVLCGDARVAADYARLMKGQVAAMAFTDPPYNVKVAGHVQGRGRVKHDEFAFASGEMSAATFQNFLSTCLGSAALVSRDGAVHFVCMDWRHIDVLMVVGREIYRAMLNLVIWHKTTPGQGSFYRSQHELIGVFRVGKAPHQNNVELGKHGRNRGNVWTYSGVNSFGAGRDNALAMHPTVKPVALVADAMRDCSSKGDIVLDPFLGSGTTIMAGEKIGRRCFGLEYEPAFVDVAIRRWQAYTKADAVLDGDGRTFDEIAEERLKAHKRPPLLSSGASPQNGPREAPGEDRIAPCDPTVGSDHRGPEAAP